ncbi:MAG: NAD-dependent epimerase/dehydratase family protein [Kiritimatiellia bacterium]|jgi:nucleoside-diphosphate-sugar epimerase
MSTILLTGASGFIGSAALAELSKHHHVITLGRKALPQAPQQTHYIGRFSKFEDLRQLDAHRIDAVIHLAAVTGGCLERDGMQVNVEGTRCLMRYLIDRGCARFVLASSTAVVGFQSPAFRPLQLPIPDDHPCLDRDGYGFSKYLMEKVSEYYVRQNPRVDVVNLRFATVVPDDGMPPKVGVGPIGQWAVGSITMLPRSKAVHMLKLAVESPIKPGVRTMNAVSSAAWTSVPVAEVLRNWWGDSVDLSYFEKPGNEHASVFSNHLIVQEFGPAVL